MTTSTDKILSFHDLRAYNWTTGKREPGRRGDGANCDRCGREHFRVFVMASGKQVGERCAQVLGFGYEASKAKRNYSPVQEATERMGREHADLLTVGMGSREFRALLPVQLNGAALAAAFRGAIKAKNGQ